MKEKQMELGELRKTTVVDAELECPQCGQKAVTTRIETERFKYGRGEAAVELSADVPVRVCGNCGFEFTDGDAEDFRHEAVCRHLAVLAPRQIIGIRLLYGLSRAEFASVTRFGEASLARWETGSLIQNPANDQLLYLLQFRENFERLRERMNRDLRVPSHRPSSATERKFVTDVERLREQANTFQLHKTAP
jgi:putative zinc finger/helix-turn-helix YgiT family protein